MSPSGEPIATPSCYLQYSLSDKIKILVMVTVTIHKKSTWKSNKHNFYPQITFEHTSQLSLLGNVNLKSLMVYWLYVSGSNNGTKHFATL